MRRYRRLMSVSTDGMQAVRRSVVISASVIVGSPWWSADLSITQCVRTCAQSIPGSRYTLHRQKIWLWRALEHTGACLDPVSLSGPNKVRGVSKGRDRFRAPVDPGTPASAGACLDTASCPAKPRTRTLSAYGPALNRSRVLDTPPRARRSGSGGHSNTREPASALQISSSRTWRPHGSRRCPPACRRRRAGWPA